MPADNPDEYGEIIAEAISKGESGHQIKSPTFPKAGTPDVYV